jgi:hypothetical protein
LCYNRVCKTVVLLAVTATLVGCADNITFTQAITTEPVGFWYGLWHGMIMPIAFIVSLFDNDVAMYAIYNNGGWYNFGYLLGIGANVSVQLK